MPAKVLIGLGVVVGVLVIALLVYGLFLFTSVKRFARYWDNQNTQPINDSSLVIVALGDSTVQAVGATSPHKGFVGQVAGRLGDDTGKSAQIYNFSRSGATAEEVATTQLQHASTFDQADVILVAVGPNDLTRGVSKETYFQHYNKILDKLPSEKVVIATIPPLVRSKVNEATIQEWNKDLAQLAAERKVRVANVYGAIEPRKYDPRIYSADLFHPSNTGYGLWADAFYLPAGQVLNSQR